MTNAVQIREAVKKVGALDVLINNAGVAIYDDLTSLDVIEQHLAVNSFGVLKMTNVFLPLLKRSKGAIVNNLSLVGLAALPNIPAFEIARKDGKTEVRFTHVGLVPTIECYGRCSGAWDFYVNGSLQSLITTGKGKPTQEQ